MKHKENDKEPLVSIVTPMYNIETFIEHTINSVLNQTYHNFELILVDDCSTDNTLEIVKGFSDDRIQLLINVENQGAGRSRNKGLSAAKGDYIAYLDADDIWHPEKLEKQIKFAKKTGAAIIYTKYDIIDSTGKVYAESGDIPVKATYHQLLRHCFIRTSSLIYDVEKCGGKVFFPDILKRQDFLMFLNLIKRFGYANLLDEITCSYRLHPNGISANKRSLIPYQWAAYRHEEKLPLPYCLFLMMNWFIRSGKVTIERKLSSLIKK